MKTKIITSIIAAAAIILTGCNREENFFSGSGKAIRFGAKIQETKPATRTAYSGEEYEIGGKIFERIDWVSGDEITINCAEASPYQSADYSITTFTDNNHTSDGKVAPVDPEKSLKWNGDQDHHIYGVYPKGFEYTNDITNETFTNPSINGNIITAELPGVQSKNLDMNYAFMAAGVTARQSNSNVILPFTPLFTAFEFNIINNQEDLNIFGISLTADSQLNGKWTTTINPDGTMTYSDLADPASYGVTNRIYVKFSETDPTAGTTTPMLLAKGDSLAFTVFTLPIDVTDLTMTITHQGGSKILHFRRNGVPITFAGGKKHKIRLKTSPYEDFMAFTIDMALDQTSMNYAIPFVAGPSPSNIMIDWGDGTKSKITKGEDLKTLAQHTYSDIQQYQIKVYTSNPPTENQIVNYKSNYYKYDKRIISFDTPFLRVNDTTMKNTFYRNENLKQIPSDFFIKNTHLTTIDGVFVHCYNLEEIPEHILDCLVNLKYLRDFTGGSVNLIKFCSKITQIPQDLLKYNTNLVEINGLFGYCKNITSIQEDLFANNTKLKNLINGFDDTGITEIPEKLFEKNTELEDVSGLFTKTKITSIPENLFINQTKLKNIRAVFSGTQITEIPKNLFLHNTELTNVSSAFSNTNISTVPVELFENNLKIEIFDFLFSSCLLLTELPDGLFEKNIKASSFRETFRDCKKLTSNSNIFIGNTYNKETRFANTDKSVNFYRTYTSASTTTSNPGTLPDLWNYTFNFTPGHSGFTMSSGPYTNKREALTNKWY